MPRRQALDATTAWGHGTTGLARPGDDDRDPDLLSASWPLGDGAPTARLSGRQASTSPTGADRISSRGDVSADERPHAPHAP
ncbi:hypothetical protein GCM10018781_03050 [Kitasatospora indigofera]|uniref:Uncharacterized protein n=1 Tax=Kitasatospora indigofera TaxID=67307 RepID=A0A919FBJ6_9ACTN|nr:hypothetical protein [Kitasatospora indigofera]GHH59584.1 hypothetical protein GCM10018781_03050 [Kitasatospora indigofera]